MNCVSWCIAAWTWFEQLICYLKVDFERNILNISFFFTLRRDFIHIVWGLLGSINMSETWVQIEQWYKTKVYSILTSPAMHVWNKILFGQWKTLSYVYYLYIQLMNFRRSGWWNEIFIPIFIRESNGFVAITI